MNHYFFLGSDGQQKGPVPADSLKVHGVTKDTLVWCDGMTNWEKASDVIELAPLFAVPPTPPLPPTPPVTPPPFQQQACPDNYLAWSIVTTILCCWPFGIPAIVNAVKVENLWMMGDKAGAIERSKAAKKWCWISFGCAIGFWILYIILVACGTIGMLALDEVYY